MVVAAHTGTITALAGRGEVMTRRRPVKQSDAPHREPVLVSRLPFWGSGFFGYLSLEVWPARQARNAAAACSRSSALLNLRRGCFGGGTATDVAPLMSSTPRRRIRLRCFIRDQFVRPDIMHFLATQQSRRGKQWKSRRLCLSAPNDVLTSSGLSGPVMPERFSSGPTRQAYTRAWRLKYKLG